MPDAEVKPEQMEERMKHLENYLESMLRIKVFRNHSETVSPFFPPVLNLLTYFCY